MAGDIVPMGGGAGSVSKVAKIERVAMNGAEVAQEGATITSYSIHALGRMAGTRDAAHMSPQAAEWIVNNGNSTYNAAKGTTLFETEIGNVVLNGDGKVVTVIAKSKITRYIR